MKKYRDHYFNKAKQENYPARSVYKLKEIDKRFRLFRPGAKVLDLGASPGSWTLYAAEKVTEKGRVTAVDLNPPGTEFPPNVEFFQEDVFERSEVFNSRLQSIQPFDAVISDMAPKTSGVKFADQARSLNLAQEALYLAGEFLRPGGSFVVKIFMGPDVKAYTEEMRSYFKQVKTFKPKSSRSESKEIFYIGTDFTGTPQCDVS